MGPTSCSPRGDLDTLSNPSFSQFLARLAAIQVSLPARAWNRSYSCRTDAGDGGFHQSGTRVLVVEDEYLIRMLLEDMLADLGYEIAAAVGTIAEASELAANAQFDVAILDVNVDGKEIYPVADILAKRGLPFVFVSGYGEGSLAEPYRGRPALQKPFQAEQIKATLAALRSK